MLVSLIILSVSLLSASIDGKPIHHRITHKTIKASDLGPPSKLHHIYKIFPHLTLHHIINNNNNNHNNNNNNVNYPYPSHFPPRRVATQVSFTSSSDLDSSSPIIYPTTYGGDPTCVNDSTTALQKAISVALSRIAVNASLSDEIYDLGGVTIDLEGGCYTISSPLNIPNGYGNIRMIDGTIRANPNGFNTPGGTNDIPKYLVIVGNMNVSSDKACTNSQGSCNENIGFENLMFDCEHVADGGLYIRQTMGCVVGPQMFFLGLFLFAFSYNGINSIDRNCFTCQC